MTDLKVRHNSATETATNMCLHAFVYSNVFTSLGYIPKSKITGSRQLCVQRVTFKDLQTAFQSSCLILPSQKQCVRVWTFPTSSLTFV